MKIISVAVVTAGGKTTVVNEMKNVTHHVTIFAKECVLVGFHISSHTI